MKQFGLSPYIFCVVHCCTEDGGGPFYYPPEHTMLEAILDLFSLAE